MKNKVPIKTDERTEEDLLVEKEDIFVDRVIYSSDIPVQIALAALIGTLLLSVLSWLIASGIWPIPYLGQFSASGDAAATFVGAGTGAALGGLIGGLMALSKLKKRNG